MKAIIENYINNSSLRSDLQDAFDFAKQRSYSRKGLMAGYEILSGEWIYAIDIENMQILEKIKSLCSERYSLSSLALAILNNKKII